MIIRLIKWVFVPAIIFIAFARNDVGNVGLAAIAVVTYGILLSVFDKDKEADWLKP